MLWKLAYEKRRVQERVVRCTSILIKMGKFKLSEEALKNSHAFTGKLPWEKLPFSKVAGLESIPTI